MKRTAAIHFACNDPDNGLFAGPKVKAICDWAGLDPDSFYVPPTKAAKPRKRPRQTARRSRVFHVTSTETGVSF